MLVVVLVNADGTAGGTFLAREGKHRGGGEEKPTVLVFGQVEAFEVAFVVGNHSVEIVGVVDRRCQLNAWSSGEYAVGGSDIYGIVALVRGYAIEFLFAGEIDHVICFYHGNVKNLNAVKDVSRSAAPVRFAFNLPAIQTTLCGSIYI